MEQEQPLKHKFLFSALQHAWDQIQKVKKYRSLGWHEIVLNYSLTTEQYQDINLWIERNIKSEYCTNSVVWLFENERDAALFVLRWA